MTDPRLDPKLTGPRAEADPETVAEVRQRERLVVAKSTRGPGLWVVLGVVVAVAAVAAWLLG